MPLLTLSYQTLIMAVHEATGARDNVFPNDYNYVALPLAEVLSLVKAYEPGAWKAEEDDCDDKARRLWHKFKEHHSLCACGIIRLQAPVAHDILGIITAEDLKACRVSVPGSRARLSSLDRDMLADDLSELRDDFIIPSDKAGERLRPVKNGGRGERSEGTDLSQRIEMTLIEPQTKEVFKRSQGGSFGLGGWSVSEIKAFAVWF